MSWCQTVKTQAMGLEMFNPLVDVHGVKFGAQVERVLVIREGYALILEAANGGR